MSQDDYGPRRQRSFDLGSVSPEQIRKLILAGVIGFTVLFLLLVAKTMVYKIEASYEGVVLRFGQHRATVPPGLHGKLPWPIDKVYKVPTRLVHTLDFGFETAQPGRRTAYRQSDDDLAVAEMLTGDLNLGHVEWIVQYRISDPMGYLFKMGDTENRPGGFLSGSSEVNPAVPDTIRDVSESVMRKLVGDSSIDYVLIIGRAELAKAAETLIQQELDAFEVGVDIMTVKLQTTSPPTPEVQDAFQEVNRAKQEKARLINDAKGKRNSIIPAARGERDKAIAEAEGYAIRVIKETLGKVEAFKNQLAEYEKAKEVTALRLYLEAMEEVLSQAGSLTIIDESTRGVLPILNLDESLAPAAIRQGARR